MDDESVGNISCKEVDISDVAKNAVFVDSVGMPPGTPVVKGKVL